MEIEPDGHNSRDTRLPGAKRPLSFDDDVALESDTSSLGSTSEHEFPIDRQFAPCGTWDYKEGRYCFSTERSIIHYSGNSAKMLQCSNGHHHDHKGKTSIPGFEFAPGGEFYKIVPPEFLPEEADIVSRRWKVSKARKRQLVANTVCANCKAPPFRGGSDWMAAWQWLQENDSELLALVQAELRNVRGFEFEKWFENLGQPMRKRLIRRLDMSSLHFDHSISRKRGNDLWLLLSADERAILQHDLILKLCRHCNLGKSAKLLPKETIVRLFVEINYGGVIAAARADERRWALVQRVLDLVYGEVSA